MPLIVNDRVRETTATSGTGSVALGGASAGFQSFQSGIGTGNTTFYTIVDSNNPPTFWEVGLGTYSNLTNTLSRDTVYSSSNGGALVNLTGVSFVFSDYPASQAVYEAKLVAGANITITKDTVNNQLVIASTGGGGGGAFSSVSARWTTANSSTKNAQVSPGQINNDGITIALVASSNPGTLAPWTITLNGAPLPSTYPSTGTFPNYSVVIPVADITGNAVQTAATVTVALANSGFNLAANNLTNVQPIAFSTVLSGSYSPSNVAFYVTTSTINYSYSNSNNITSFGGIITPVGALGQNATSPSGSFAGQPIGGATISGNATGMGLNGAGSSTVNLTGSIPPVTVFTPAWFSQTANNTPPLFQTTDAVAPATPVTNTNYQTASAAQGSTITYPVATSATQYDWICTQRPLANLLLVTPFGSAALIPDVTASQTLGGQTFQIYGFTRLSTNAAAVLVIN